VSVSRLSKFGILFTDDSKDFLLPFVTMDETWLYHYDQETNQQSMERKHSGSHLPAPKNFECKIPLEKFSHRVFGIKTAPLD
jgi:hypothetical protein